MIPVNSYPIVFYCTLTQVTSCTYPSHSVCSDPLEVSPCPLHLLSCLPIYFNLIGSFGTQLEHSTHQSIHSTLANTRLRHLHAVIGRIFDTDPASVLRVQINQVPQRVICFGAIFSHDGATLTNLSTNHALRSGSLMQSFPTCSFIVASKAIRTTKPLDCFWTQHS